MEELTLVRVREAEEPFSQYLPKNFHPLLSREDNLCVGAVYKGMACAAALAEAADFGEYHLRYIFVDPAARLCGLGTYLLNGLIGQLQKMGAVRLKAIYTPKMVENEGHTFGILERAGFSSPKPISTAFSVSLGDIRDPSPTLPDEMKVYNALELPQELMDAYEDLVLDGSLPDFADARQMKAPSAEITSFCAVDGKLAGLMLVDRRDGGLYVAGLYVLDGYRRGRTAAALIGKSLCEARRLCPPETEVFTSTISREAFSICDKLFKRNSTTNRETELLSIYSF